jgi:hypothetical protein
MILTSRACITVLDNCAGWSSWFVISLRSGSRPATSTIIACNALDTKQALTYHIGMRRAKHPKLSMVQAAARKVLILIVGRPYSNTSAGVCRKREYQHILTFTTMRRYRRDDSLWKPAQVLRNRECRNPQQAAGCLTDYCTAVDAYHVAGKQWVAR